MTGNNPKLDLVNFDAHKKTGQILSVCFQGIERKQNSDINQGPKLCKKFAKKMTGNSPKLDLVSVEMCTQILVRFCQFFLKILSGNEILTSIMGCKSVKILQKMTCNNPKLDLVNADVHTKFGQILLICSQDIKRK